MWYNDEDMAHLHDIVGKTLVKIDVDHDEIVFVTSDGETYKFLHEQDCCESVAIDEVVGDWLDLLDSPLTLAEESTNREDTRKVEPDSDGYTWQDDSFTWTFYRFATVKGYVNVKWYGASNGYYSESVSFIKVK